MLKLYKYLFSYMILAFFNSIGILESDYLQYELNLF